MLRLSWECYTPVQFYPVLPKTSISPLKAVCRRFMELSYQNQFHVYYSNTSVRPKLQYEIRFYAVNNVMLTVFFWLLCAFFSRISRGKYVFYIICWFPRLFENFLCIIVNILPDLDILYEKDLFTSKKRKFYTCSCASRSEINCVSVPIKGFSWLWKYLSMNVGFHM